MKHTISNAVRMSIANGDSDISDFVPNLTETDPARIYPILNHRNGEPFLPPHLQHCPHSWEHNQSLEEHPYVAISFVHNGTQHTKALVEPFPPEYPAHQVLRHVADALEMLEQGDMPANDWEMATMRNQVTLTARKATAGVHSMTYGQVQALFEGLLKAELPPLTMMTALDLGTGNDPHLKRVVTDHTRFPQETVLHEDALSVLNHAAGKVPPTMMKHVAMAMGFLPREVELQKTPAPAEHKARIIRAAERAGIPQHLIETIQQEL